MRLGFWNRLALVATGLALIVGPLAIQTRMKYQLTQSEQDQYGICFNIASSKMERAIRDGKPHTFNADADACAEDWMRSAELFDPFTWEKWSGLATTTLGLAALLYCLIWLGVIVSRWVWKGRSVKVN